MVQIDILPAEENQATYISLKCARCGMHSGVNTINFGRKINAAKCKFCGYKTAITGEEEKFTDTEICGAVSKMNGQLAEGCPICKSSQNPQ